MMLTPLDIRHKEFRRSMRGYSEEEVDVFLDEVADEFERLFQQNIDTQERVQRLEEQVSQYEKLKETLQATMITAQQQSDEMRANARKESELVLKDAELKSRDIVGEAYTEKQRVQQSLIQLRQVEEDFRFKFRSLLEAHLNLLAEDEVSEDRRQFRGLVASVEEQLVEEPAEERGVPGPVSRADVDQDTRDPFPWTMGGEAVGTPAGGTEGGGSDTHGEEEAVEAAPVTAAPEAAPTVAEAAPVTMAAETVPPAAWEQSPAASEGDEQESVPGGRPPVMQEAVVDTSAQEPYIDSAPTFTPAGDDQPDLAAVPALSDVADDFFGDEERPESSVRRFLFGRKDTGATGEDQEADDREFKW